MRHQRQIAAVFLAAALAACGTDTLTSTDANQLSVRVSPSSVPAAGAPLGVELINNSANAVGYNLCAGARLEVRRASQWTPVEVEGRYCTLPLFILDASSRRNEQYPLSSMLQAGTYRLVVQFRPERADAPYVSSVSGAFVVQ